MKTWFCEIFANLDKPYKIVLLIFLIFFSLITEFPTVISCLHWTQVSVSKVKNSMIKLKLNNFKLKNKKIPPKKVCLN